LCSLVFEQGVTSKRISVVDLSSDEEDLFPDTSWDEEFITKLFGDLNHRLLGSPSDGNVIILSDSDENEEMVCEEDAADADAAPPSTVMSSAPTISTTDADDASEGVQNDSNDSHTPDWA
jgi:hypothetical protein